MAIAVDDTTYSRTTGTPGDNVDITTAASGTPAVDSLAVVCVSSDTDDVSSATSLQVSDSVDGNTGWSELIHRDDTDSGGTGGCSAIWTKQFSSAASRTISLRRTTGNGGTNRLSFKAYIVTSEDTSDFLGASGEGSSTTNNLTASIFTSEAANSYAFVAATDYNQRGSPTSTDLTEDSADYAGAISVTSGYKDVGTAGAETANLDAGGSSAAAWTWVAIEVKAATGGGGVAAIPKFLTLLGVGA